MRQYCKGFLPFFIALALATPFLTQAQTAAPKKPATSSATHPTKGSDNTWNLDIGPTVAFPLRYLNMFASFGPGIDASLTHPLDNGLAIGGRVNYAYYFGRKPDPNLGGLAGTDRYPGTSLVNILGDAHYMFPSNLQVGVNLGLGMTIFNGFTSTGFARILYIGYQAEGDHIMTYSLYFNETNYMKNVGARVAFRL